MNDQHYLASSVSELEPYEVLDFFDGPRLYSCRSAVGQLFLVLWVQQTEDSTHWLYAEVSLDRYNALKSGAISIQAAFTDAEMRVVWNVVASDQGELSVEVVPCEQIDVSILPPEDDFLQLPTHQLPNKPSSIEDAASSSYRGVVDIAIKTPADSQAFLAP